MPEHKNEGNGNSNETRNEGRGNERGGFVQPGDRHRGGNDVRGTDNVDRGGHQDRGGNDPVTGGTGGGGKK